MGLWDRQDTETAPKVGSPWDILETPGETVGKIEHWNNSMGILEMSWGLPVGLWGKQDTRPTPKTRESVGCPRDSLTIQWDLGQSYREWECCWRLWT